MATQKLRPYLSLEEIQYLLSLLESKAAAGEKEAIALRFNLTSLCMKYDLGIVQSQYTTKPRKTLQEALGITSEEERKYLAGEMTPEEEEAYTTMLMKGTGV